MDGGGFLPCCDWRAWRFSWGFPCRWPGLFPQHQHRKRVSATPNPRLRHCLMRSRPAITGFLQPASANAPLQFKTRFPRYNIAAVRHCAKLPDSNDIKPPSSNLAALAGGALQNLVNDQVSKLHSLFVVREEHRSPLSKTPLLAILSLDEDCGVVQSAAPTVIIAFISH